MPDQQPPSTSPKPDHVSQTPQERTPWTPPTLQTLEVSQTMVMVGAGGDAGAPGSTLS